MKENQTNFNKINERERIDRDRDKKKINDMQTQMRLALTT